MSYLIQETISLLNKRDAIFQQRQKTLQQSQQLGSAIDKLQVSEGNLSFSPDNSPIANLPDPLQQEWKSLQASCQTFRKEQAQYAGMNQEISDLQEEIKFFEQKIQQYKSRRTLGIVGLLVLVIVALISIFS